MKTALIWFLVLVVVSMIVLPHSFVQAKSKDSKAKDAIIKAIGKSVEGKYSTIKLIQLSKSNVSGYVIAYNTTKAVPLPPTPSPTPTPTPTPVPNPTGPTTTVCLVGDLKGSTVPNLMKNCNLKIGLGDLGYQNDLSYFKSLNFNKCTIGNHDSPEDGNANLYKEALAYCGDHWSLNIGNHTLMMGFNTNGDIQQQVTQAKQVLQSQANHLNTVIVVSHKGGHVPPNSHHPAEAATLYKNLEALIPANVKLVEVFAHNHVSSSAPSKNWYQAGSGGRSFYSCGVDQTWTYCDNTHLQFLQLTIDNSNGNTVANFIR